MSLPQTRFARLQYMESHVEPFADHQADIGISVVQLGQFTANASAARAAWDSYVAARQAASAARTAWYEAIATATGTTRSALRSINTFAKNSDNPGAVYALAQVEAPKPPEPLGPPAVPADLAVSLDTEGRATLRWAGSRHGGTVFTVQRRTTSTSGQTGPWTTLVTVPERVFIDPATPVGVLSVGYRVRGERVGGASAYSSPIALPMGTGGNQDGPAGAIAPQEPSGLQAG